jgi:hypothetical protein
MIVVKTKLVRWVGAAAMTFYPFVFIDPIWVSWPSILAHEAIHIRQQRSWAIYGLGIGLLAWYLLYLLALPVGWNPFRYKWEYEAYKEGSKYSDETIKKIMKQRPYYLWWMNQGE